MHVWWSLGALFHKHIRQRKTTEFSLWNGGAHQQWLHCGGHICKHVFLNPIVIVNRYFPLESSEREAFNQSTCIQSCLLYLMPEAASPSSSSLLWNWLQKLNPFIFPPPIPPVPTICLSSLPRHTVDKRRLKPKMVSDTYFSFLSNLLIYITCYNF